MTIPQNLNTMQDPQMNMYPGYPQMMDPNYMYMMNMNNFDRGSEYQTNPNYGQFNPYPYYNQPQVRNPMMNYNQIPKK